MHWSCYLECGNSGAGQQCSASFLLFLKANVKRSPLPIILRGISCLSSRFRQNGLGRRGKPRAEASATSVRQYRVLTGKVGESVEHGIRAVCGYKGCEVVELNVQFDHVHLIMLAPPKVAIGASLRRVAGIPYRLPSPCAALSVPPPSTRSPASRASGRPPVSRGAGGDRRLPRAEPHSVGKAERGLERPRSRLCGRGDCGATQSGGSASHSPAGSRGQRPGSTEVETG